jgi:Glycosyltransferases, probably involved in cell wall biogenesis
MRIAALIPVYSEPKALASICESLATDSYPDKEIVVVVDGDTTPAIAAALGRITRHAGLRVIEGQGHLGKAAALNRAAAAVDADALLFLDNDIFMPRSPSFLSDLAYWLEKRDLVELPKVGVGSGFFARMMQMEFLANIYTAGGVAAELGACPSMNGAAFAMRKELFMELGGFAATVDEDMDLAARAFLAGGSFGFPPELAVGNAVSEGPKDWSKQRKRWMANNALWSESYLWPCLTSSSEAALALARSALRFGLPWIAALAGALPAFLVASLLDSQAHWLLLAAALGAGGAWSIAAGSYDRCARRYGASFSFGAFFVYSFIYMPVVAIGNLSSFIAISFGAMPKLDWKLGSGLPERTINLGRRMKAERRGRLDKALSLRAARELGTASRLCWGPKLAPPRSLGLSVAYARYRVRSEAERFRS